MVLQIHHLIPDGIDAGTLVCDVETADDCYYMDELGEHGDWTDEHYAAHAVELGWRYDAAHQNWLCPACRLSPVTLAAAAFPRDLSGEIAEAAARAATN